MRRDSFFAREQAEAKRNEVERARLAEESEFSVFHSSRVELEKQALEEERQALEVGRRHRNAAPSPYPRGAPLSTRAIFPPHEAAPRWHRAQHMC
eukprot:COSAG05_NODE_355_length_10856_cov_7.197174_4_plen_95_part_00